jgi:HD-like signal output (HDOD) protein
MHTHRTRATALVDPAGLKQALLGLVCEDHQPFWSLAELDRTLAPSEAARSGADPSRADVEDAVADLYAAGLIHRIGDFVFATRAALEAERVSA